jgi:excisionase family DNA binding protein
MAGKFIPLDEAARTLGVPADRLVDMIKQGDIRGFRDGASWKFPEQEIARVQEDGFDALDEMPIEGSSILISEHDLGAAVRSGSVVIGGDKRKNDPDSKGSGSDIDLGVAPDPDGSGLMLTPRASESDVRLVPSGKTPGPTLSDDGSLDDLLKKDARAGKVDKRSGSSFDIRGSADDLLLDAGERPRKSGSASSIDLGKLSAEDVMEKADVRFAPVQSSDNLELFDDHDLASEMPTSAPGIRGSHGNVLSDMDLLGSAHGGSGLIRGDSSEAVLSGSNLGSLLGGESTPITDGAADGSDLAIADDDDLVLGASGSDLAIAGDSGLNLMSPSDSGLSLEAEPLDLAGSSISALDLAVDGHGSSKSGVGPGSSGSLVDFRADEEFNLSPSGVGIETDEDSGSQVIEVEDSADAFGGAGMEEGGVLDAAGFSDFGDVDQGQMGGDAEMVMVDDSATGEETMQQSQSVGMVPAYEVPFSVFNVLALLSVLMVMSLGGMIMTDMVRNIADYAGADGQVNSLTDALLGMFGLKS